ncbi:MAG: hypothetical protein LLG16_07700 [Euryarchaeota archaeon]|nr:hypothetical protein [Euryarchaeota archaeon]
MKAGHDDHKYDQEHACPDRSKGISLGDIVTLGITESVATYMVGKVTVQW